MTDLKEFQRLAHIEEDIENFVKKGYNLFIHSAIPGNGKTSWARRMIKSYFDHTWPMQDLTECKALFIQVSPFLQALKDNITTKNPEVQYIKENITNADIVVWDDLGTEIGSEYDINQLLGFIDRRTAAGKTNIYTSNLTRQEMEFKVGKRLASRVGMSIDIELRGKDKRVMSAQTEEY